MAHVFDLDAERARREATETPTITIGGNDYPLPSELPVDIFSPFLAFSREMSLLLVAIKDVITGQDQQIQAESVNLIIDLLATNHELPVEVLQAVQEMSRKLLGDDCYEAFVGARPSLGDIKAFTGWIMDFYGVSLGESGPSSDSSADGGQTSKPISSGSTDSTPEASGATPETPEGTSDSGALAS